MSVTIDLCVTNDNNTTVNKSYNILAENVTIDATHDLDELSPEFIIRYNAEYKPCNYVVANFLGRKYFCEKILSIGKKMKLKCTVDYLSSWDLSKCNITVIRNDGIGKPTIFPDSKLPIAPNQQTIKQTVAENSAINAAAERCYVLACIGGDITQGGE